MFERTRQQDCRRVLASEVRLDGDQASASATVVVAEGRDIAAEAVGRRDWSERHYRSRQGGRVIHIEQIGDRGTKLDVAGGKPAGNVAAGWDLKTNKKV